MSGFDKYLLSEKLIALGWQQGEDGRLTPPESLWEKKPVNFAAYDAATIQQILGEWEHEEDE